MRFAEYANEKAWSPEEFGKIVTLRREKFDPQKSLESQKDIELDNIASASGRILGFIDSKTQKSIKNKFYKGDILYGKLRPYLQKFAKAPWDGVASSELWVFEHKKVTSDFLLQLVQTRTFLDAVNVQSGSKMPRAEWSIVKSAPFSIPNKPEQQKIASFLATVDTRREKLEQKITLLKAYKKGVMQKIFSQEVRFRDENDGEYPEWEENRLGEVTDFVNGYTFLSSTYADNGSYKVITIANVQQGNMNGATANTIHSLPTNIQSEQILAIGDILISMTGNVGRVCLVNEQNCLLNQRVGKIIAKNINKEYLYHTINSPRFVAQMTSSGQGGAQDNLSSKDIKNYRLQLPSPDEQKKIAEYLTALDDKIKTEEKHLTSAKAWKEGLLQRMFI